MHSPLTQKALIMDYLTRGKPLTAAQAVDKWGIYRLASRIYDLRKSVKIEVTKRHRGNKVWAEYRLAK